MSGLGVCVCVRVHVHVHAWPPLMAWLMPTQSTQLGLLLSYCTHLHTQICCSLWHIDLRFSIILQSQPGFWSHSAASLWWSWSSCHQKFQTPGRHFNHTPTTLSITHTHTHTHSYHTVFMIEVGPLPCLWRILCLCVSDTLVPAQWDYTNKTTSLVMSTGVFFLSKHTHSLAQSSVFNSTDPCQFVHRCPEERSFKQD